MVNIYDAQRIESLSSVALTEGGLLLFALLCGGDYDVRLFLLLSFCINMYLF